MRKPEDKASVTVALDGLRRDVDAARRAPDSTFLAFGALNIGTGASDRWLNPLTADSASSTTELFMPAPRSGTIVGLAVYVASLGDAAADRTVAFVVRRKSLDTPVKVQVTVPKFTGTAQSKSKAVEKVERGDLLSVVVHKSGTFVTSPGPIIAFVEIQ